MLFAYFLQTKKKDKGEDLINFTSDEIKEYADEFTSNPDAVQNNELIQ